MDTNTYIIGVLRHRAARDKYDSMISDGIYSEAATFIIKKQFRKILEQQFIEKNTAWFGEFDAFRHSNGDIQKLHSGFQFQRQTVTNFDTLDWRLGLTDLTAALANFTFMATVANLHIRTEKYYRYSQNAQAYCCLSTLEITHIYVYIRDSYSFLDRTGSKTSQYLGHWNRNGVILVPSSLASDFAAGYGADVRLIDGPSTGIGFDKPVDVLKGMFGEMRQQDVFYPVRNSDYARWRKKFNRGGDFLIYSGPKKIKLATPIKLTLDEICKPVKPSHG